MGNSEPEGPVSSGSIYWLAPSVIEDLTKRAKENDLGSALKLYNYYTFSGYNEIESLLWLERSASLGSFDAKFNLASRYRGSGQLEKAADLAETLMKAQYPGADKLLESIIFERAKIERK